MTRSGNDYPASPYGAPETWINPPAPQAPPAQAAPPKTNGGWAIATVIFFWPLAFVAFSRALSVPMLWSTGQHDAARDASNSVARLGKISLIIGILLVVLIVVLEIAVFSSISSTPTPTYPSSEFSY